MIIYKNVQIACMLGLIICLYSCFAENFLASTPLKRRHTVSQIRQDIVETLADILMSTSKSIELQSQVQQELCLRIQELTQATKQGPIHNLNNKEIEQYLIALKNIKTKKEQEILELKNIYTLLKNGPTKKA
jgi:hypothetical protein